ncbi:MAG: hypothetical protein JNL82_29765 [Myxococcales bacterium]|nr:hypothetical protein [Myxococcales bacterium]
MADANPFLWTAVISARAAMRLLPATERGEDSRASDRAVPAAHAVRSASSATLAAHGLALVPVSVSAAKQGATGCPEVDIVFALLHPGSGEREDFAVTWAVADAANVGGRAQAVSATVTLAEKSMLMHLLGIGYEDPLGPMPTWSEPKPATGACPVGLESCFRRWQERRLAIDSSASVAWADLVAEVNEQTVPEWRTRPTEEARAVVYLQRHFPVGGAP